MLVWSGRWAYSLDNKKFFQLSARNKKAALREIKDCFNNPDVNCIWIGKTYKYEPHIYAEDIIKVLQNQCFREFHTETGEELKVGKIIYDDEKVCPDEKYLSDYSDEMRGGLEGRLNGAVKNWEKYYKLAYSKFVVKDVVCIERNRKNK